MDGFYDGDGQYVVRFMPSFEGEYRYEITAGFLETPVRGSFCVTAPSEGNHGPVRVAQTYHFAYEDGTPYQSIGTTCYVWTHQPQELQEQTLQTLSKTAFNKIRFCIFPKSYDYNYRDPITFPYEGTPCDASGMGKDNYNEYTPDTPGNHWDFYRFRPDHFRNIETRIQQLAALGIEADLIVMHPYDRWGFSKMPNDANDLYWRYVLARFSAYRNVWWSFSNEYDLFPNKTEQDWEHYANIVVRHDPYRHLRSIHNCMRLYDFSRPWTTHCSVQRQAGNLDIDVIPRLRTYYQKPVVMDEMCYEGNLEHGWGNISAQEMVRRSWEVVVRGGYPGHGETYEHPDNIIWWSHGGELHGESPKRLAFLGEILEEVPGRVGLKPGSDWHCATPDRQNDNSGFRLYYFGQQQPLYKHFHFDDEWTYQVDVIDTWNMTVTPAGTFRGKFRVDLPGRDYIAIRCRRVSE